MKKYETPLGGPLLAMSLRVAALVGAVLSWGARVACAWGRGPQAAQAWRPGGLAARGLGSRLAWHWGHILANLSK